MNDIYKRRRIFVIFLFIGLSAFGLYKSFNGSETVLIQQPNVVRNTELANIILKKLPISEDFSDFEYERSYFGESWGSINGCSTRDVILFRDLVDITRGSDCSVLSGNLIDPYTGKLIKFTRGKDTSSKVQIDHVVSLSDAWRKGAYLMNESQRISFANDPLELLAVDGNENMKKSDSDAGEWLPKNVAYRCEYVSRQIAVKFKYNLWIDKDESSAMNRILNGCPDQRLPEK